MCVCAYVKQLCAINLHRRTRQEGEGESKSHKPRLTAEYTYIPPHIYTSYIKAQAHKYTHT